MESIALARATHIRVTGILITCALLIFGLQVSALADEPRRLFVSPDAGPAGTTVTVSGTGWDPEYYSSGVEISFEQNFGNGVLTPYADAMRIQPDSNGRFSFDSEIPSSFQEGDLLSFFGLIGNGSGEQANFTVTSGVPGAGGTPGPASGPDLAPTEITFDRTATMVGGNVHFDSGIRNSGGQDTDIFNIKWFVNGQEVGAYGSHEGIAASTTVSDGNSQFDWVFDSPGSYSVQFAVDVDNHVAESNEENNRTTVSVDVPVPGGSSGSSGGSSDPIFYCLRGPNGGCNGVMDPAAPTGGPTWNQYLDYLDNFAGGVSNLEAGVSCTQGVINPRDPANILGCLGIMTSRYPAVGVALDALGCGIGATVPSCLSLGAQSMKGIVFTIRQAANVDPGLRMFLETRMF